MFGGTSLSSWPLICRDGIGDDEDDTWEFSRLVVVRESSMTAAAAGWMIRRWMIG